jgi:hypothetical protein
MLNSSLVIDKGMFLWQLAKGEQPMVLINGWFGNF